MADTTKVQAQDGKTYEFSARSKVKKESEVQQDGSIVTKFVFRNGVVREAVMPRDSALYGKAAAHGLDQKYGDEFAGMDDVEDCVEAFDNLAARIARGEWTEKRVSDGLAGTSLLVRELVRMASDKGETADAGDIKAFLNGLDDDARKAMPLLPEVAKVIAELKAEKAQTKAKPGIEEAGAKLRALFGA